MKKCIESNMNFEETGFAYSMSLISGKYKLPILYSLAFYGTFRVYEKCVIKLLYLIYNEAI